MEYLSNILNSIQQHSNEETRQGGKNRAIAHGNIHFTNGILGNKEIWITNENPKANIDITHDITGAIAGVKIKAGVHTLSAKYGASVGKNLLQKMIQVMGKYTPADEIWEGVDLPF